VGWSGEEAITLAPHTGKSSNLSKARQRMSASQQSIIQFCICLANRATEEMAVINKATEEAAFIKTKRWYNG
jgi:hypothetical protein